MSCPICKKTAHPTYRPFCSRRCADVDLGRWVTGGYAIETTEEPEEFSETPPFREGLEGDGKLH
ncbi:DNA gyrase inhibitor YacG [Meridianimarinicoccus sp. MJW13]|uniref:DNA gyrase inhibitor YacG n=1 Tax=Meridianimarinicoccus sp. MJW13 TaxID=2720031 RepID=UPI001866F2EE|nr:DNA gyrase inhibitor YacG [Fluviibacterium sp. MJW13]